jgi:hypothetical protein
MQIIIVFDSSIDVATHGLCETQDARVEEFFKAYIYGLLELIGGYVFISVILAE